MTEFRLSQSSVSALGEIADAETRVLLAQEGSSTESHAHTDVSVERTYPRFIGSEFGLGITDYDIAEAGLREVHRFRGDI